MVEKLGVTEIHYPIYYHGYEPEHDDPFFDRDYNICILCGRCVRMCQEVRGTAVLAFTYRGPRAKIGPAFGRNHVEAGCEFCGACVDVCPTGALADKASKWDGKPDGFDVVNMPVLRSRLPGRAAPQGRPALQGQPEPRPGGQRRTTVRPRAVLHAGDHHHFERAKKPMLKRANISARSAGRRRWRRVAAHLKGFARTSS